MNPSVISDQTFWKTWKTIFSKQRNFGNKIKIVENEEIIDNDTEVAEEVNSFYKIALVSLDIHWNQNTAENVENISHSVDTLIKKFEFHSSILLIKNRIGKNISQNFFCFNEVIKAEVLKEINSIKSKKATTFNIITSKIL